MTWTRFAFMLGSVFAMACSSAEDTGPAPAGDTGGTDTTTPTDGSKDDTTPPPGDTTVPTDTTPPPTDTTPPPTDTGGGTCKTATITSTCGPNGVVRAVVKLGAGMPDATGPIVVKLNHLRLGSAGTGGYPHTGTTVPSTTVSASTGVDVAFDFCAGGEMWSEDNCEFNLFGFVDKNGNGSPDAGEPAGRTVVTMSCKGSPPCFSLVLGCTSGMSCITYTDPGACKCATPTCSSPIKTCT